MGITPTDAEMLEAIIASALIDVHVALPGQIQSYSPATQTATVQLQVKRVLPASAGKFATEDLPVLENVPVEFLRTKTHMVTLPLVAGDYGLVVFSEMSLDQWRSKGENTSPGDIGRHTLTGGVFRPGLMPVAQTIPPPALGGDDIGDDIVIGLIGGGQIRVKPDGSVQAVAGGLGGQSADDFVTMAGRLLAAMGVMLAAGAANPAAGAANFAAAKSAWDVLIATPAGDIAAKNLKANEALIP